VKTLLFGPTFAIFQRPVPVRLECNEMSTDGVHISQNTKARDTAVATTAVAVRARYTCIGSLTISKKMTGFSVVRTQDAKPLNVAKSSCALACVWAAPSHHRV